jgi:hypothetical protein
MIPFLQNISETVKGVALMLYGTVLLLHGFGILRSRLDLIIIISGIIMIIYAFIILNGPKKFSRVISEISKK